jgi:aspartate aminotransferase
MSFFDTVTHLPEDPILSIPIAFKADPRKEKVNLGVGSYLDDEGKPYLFPCVKTAENRILDGQKEKEYSPIDGPHSFTDQIFDLVFGSGAHKERAGHFFAAQALGGTGALRLGGDFLFQEVSKVIFLPKPTWPNHKPIFMRSGLKVHTYRYYDEKHHHLDFPAMCSDIKDMPPGSIILLQAGCNNPTGVDLSKEQWGLLSRLIKEQRIIPFFDFAYQGFGDGVEEDAYPMRLFADEGHEMLVASSYSKNFGLYGERVGVLSILCQHKGSVEPIGSQVKQLIRSNYSNPPRHGAQIISTILSSPDLKKAWLEDLSNLRERIKEMRHVFALQLQTKSGNGDWISIQKQRGFFSLLGLSTEQVQRLNSEFAIYMPLNGRINIAGLNQHNIDYVVNAIIAVTKP